MANAAAKPQSFGSLCTAVRTIDRQSDDCIIEVQMQMKNIYEYENQTDTEVEIMSKITKGFLTREKDLKKEKSALSFDVNTKGNVNWKILKLEATAKYSKESYHEVLMEKELTNGDEIVTRYNVPPKSKLIRWQLVANVDNETIGFGKFIDTTKDLTKEMKESTLKGEAVIHLPRKIIFGNTEIRIRHKDTNKYLIPVLVENKWDSITLKADSNYYFQLEECPGGVRIKALSCTTANWCYVYSGGTGNLYLTKQAEGDLTQIWIINKRSDLRNGDVVTFRNKYWETAGLCHQEINRKTNVFCINNKEDEWILEM